MAELTTKQKVAIVLLYLGVENASAVLKFLDEYLIEELCREIANLGSVDQKVVEEVLKEFHSYLLAEIGVKGGMGYLREVLERTLGASRAMLILNRISEKQPFTYLKDIPAAQLATLLSEENPQTIAVILSYMPASHAAAVMSKLPHQKQLEVAMRIANLKEAESQTIRSIDKALEKEVFSQKMQSTITLQVQSGTKVLAEILCRTDSKTEKALLEELKKINPQLSEELRKQMFLFEDIVKLDDRSIQRILREVDSKDLTLALKLADDQLKEKIFKNMSERARDLLKEEMNYLGPVRIRQVEEAQQRILEKIRYLESAGEIIIPKPGEEEDRFV